MPLIALAGLGLAGSIGGALIGSSAAGSAADTQSAAANHAADLQYKASQDALNFQKQQYGQTQTNSAPWLQSGAGALGNLDYLLGITPPSTQGTMTGGPLTPYGGTQQPGGSVSPLQRTGGSVGPVATNGGPAMPTARAMGQPMSGAVPSINGPASMGGGLNIPARATPQPAQTGPAQIGAPGIGYPPAIAGSSNFGATAGGTGGQPAPGVSGTTDLGSVVNPNNGGFGSLMQGYGQTFQAPTDITMQNDPGYQARLQLGTDALQKSAAARGSVLTGGTAKALDSYAQDYASNEYGNVYNRALTGFQTGYNQYNNDQTNQYNRLAALAGIGQQTASQLGSAGQAASNNVSSNLLNTANNMGNSYQNAAAANASGTVGSANAWSGALGQSTNNLQQLMLLGQLQGGNQPDTITGSGSNQWFGYGGNG